MYRRIIHLVQPQNFAKTKISYPLIHTSTCAYQGIRNVCFPENLACVLNEWSQAKRGREKSYFELALYCITSRNSQNHHLQQPKNFRKLTLYEIFSKSFTKKVGVLNAIKCVYVSYITIITINTFNYNWDFINYIIFIFYFILYFINKI